MSKTRKWASYHLFTIADVPKVDLSQTFAPFCVIHTSRLCLEVQPVLLRKEGAPPLECLLMSSHTTVVRGCLVYLTPTSLYVHMSTGPFAASSIIALFMLAANGLVFFEKGLLSWVKYIGYTVFCYQLETWIESPADILTLVL